MQCVECRTQITIVQSARHAYLNKLTESTLPNLSKSTYRLLLKLQLSHPDSVLLSPALDTAFNDSGLLFGFGLALATSKHWQWLAFILNGG